MKVSNLFLKNWTLIVYLCNKIGKLIKDGVDQNLAYEKPNNMDHITKSKGERKDTILRGQRREERERHGINKKAERTKKGNERISKRERGKYYRIKNSVRQSLYYSEKIKEKQEDNVYL